MFNCSLLSRTFPSACKRNYCFPPLVQSEEVNSPSFLWQAETVNDWDTTIDRVYCPNYNPVPNQPSLFRLPSWHFGDFLTYFLVHKDGSLIFKNLMCFFFIVFTGYCCKFLSALWYVYLLTSWHQPKCFSAKMILQCAVKPVFTYTK